MPKEVFYAQQMTNTTPFAQRNITKGHLLKMKNGVF